MPANPLTAAIPVRDGANDTDSARFSMAGRLLAQLHSDSPDPLRGLLEPAPGNLRLLSAELAAKIGEILVQAGIDPGLAVDFEVDDTGTVRVGGHRQDADRIAAVLDAHPQVQRLIAYLHVLTCQAEAIGAQGNVPSRAFSGTGTAQAQKAIGDTLLPGNPFMPSPAISQSGDAPSNVNQRIALMLVCVALAVIFIVWHG